MKLTFISMIVCLIAAALLVSCDGGNSCDHFTCTYSGDYSLEICASQYSKQCRHTVLPSCVYVDQESGRFFDRPFSTTDEQYVPLIQTTLTGVCPTPDIPVATVDEIPPEEFVYTDAGVRYVPDAGTVRDGGTRRHKE